MKSWIHVLATDPVERKLIEAQQKKRDCELNIKHFCLRTECFRNVELHRFHLLHSRCTFYTKTNPTLTQTWVWFLKSPDGENMSVYTTCCRPQVCVLSAVQVCVRCVSPKQCCTKLILWYEGVGVFCSVTVLLRHSHLLLYFILGRAISCLIRSLNLCCFLLAVLIKKYHFQLLRNYTSWFIFKIAGCNFHIIIQNIFILQFLGRFRVQAKQKAWEKCFADCSGGSSNSPDNTHAHTHLQKFWFLCLVIYLNQGHHCARGQAELALTLYLLIYSRL